MTHQHVHQPEEQCLVYLFCVGNYMYHVCCKWVRSGDEGRRLRWAMKQSDPTLRGKRTTLSGISRSDASSTVPVVAERRDGARSRPSSVEYIVTGTKPLDCLHPLAKTRRRLSGVCTRRRRHMNYA